MPTLTSDRCSIKWTHLADLPVPLYGGYVAIQHHKMYITGNSPIEDAVHQVYVYDINTDQWDKLPPSGHYYGIPHVIGGKLVIIGGRLSATKKRTNKVSTFDEDSQTWTRYYPDLLSVRSKPGIVSHLEHVIVAGGDKGDDTKVTQDDIEVLNWIENSHWKKASIKLPTPMCSFIPTISDDHLFIVGYTDERLVYKSAYKIPVDNVVVSLDEQHIFTKPIKWTELTSATHFSTALIPSSLPLVAVGGCDNDGKTTANIEIYDNITKLWKKIGSLSSARSKISISTLYNNAIVVIGGCTKGRNVTTCKSSSLTVVELGQFLHD